MQSQNRALVPFFCLFAIIVVGLTPNPGPTDQGTVTRQQDLTAMQPGFRTIWLADACLQIKKQTWDDYWGWINIFYFGTVGKSGWFDTTDGLLASVSDSSAKTLLHKRLETLGKRVAGEWSKDNSCRKISTFGSPGIVQFDKLLSAAKSAETGDGSSISNALDKIDKDVDAAIGVSP